MHPSPLPKPDVGSIGTEAGVLDHLRRYARPDLAAKLKGRDSYNDDAYDWKLNGR